MTVEQVFKIVDELMPNGYSEERKLEWLSALDGKIYNEVISTHAGGPDEFVPYSDIKDELLVEFPYAEDIYVFHLESMICLQNFETQKYNQFAAMFKAKYKEWANWYHRTHKPLGRPRVWW